LFPKFLRNESGYSLVEVMAAIMILAIAILPMVSMFDAGLEAATTSSNYDTARALANEKLEEVRALPYNRSGSPADSAVEIYRPGSPVSGTEGSFNYTITTNYWFESGGNLQAAPDNSIMRPMMQIAVTVTWPSGNSYTTTGFTATGAS
jgi:prepilin-type N-terminal cleavage/methylation domain-containing protein